MKFNVDEFLKGLNKKAKKIAHHFVSSRIEITINGKKVVHEMPCALPNCRICEKITDIEQRTDRMIGHVDKIVSEVTGMMDKLFEDL